MATEIFRRIEGLYLGKHFREDAVRSAFAYKPLPGDLFLAAYPKSGSTWAQIIIYYILMDGEDPEDPLEPLIRLPLLEMRGANAAMYAPRPAVFKTHSPFYLAPYSPDAKYIYIARNPYDTCVSYYYHTRNIPAYRFQDGTFEEFFELFLTGRVDFGDYFESVLSWYEHRNDENILFLTYEELIRDTPGYVLKMAAFIDPEKEKTLQKNSDIMTGILEKTNFENMKTFLQLYVGQMASRASPFFKLIRPELLESLQNGFDFYKAPMTGEFVRNGAVGDWRNHFSPEQVSRMKKRIAEAVGHTDLMNLWKDVSLP